MAKTYCECGACGYLIPVDSTECANCGIPHEARPDTARQSVVRIPDAGVAAAPALTQPVAPSEAAAFDELLVQELRSLRRMQERQGRSLLRWLKLQTIILALTGLFVTIIILLAYIAITGPIG